MLAPIEQTAGRIRVNHTLAELATGLWVAALAAGGLAVARLVTGGSVPGWLAPAGGVVVLAYYAVRGWTRPLDVLVAARRIDEQYRWPSVAVSAVSLAAKQPRREAEDLSLASAASQLGQVRPAEVVTYKLPSRWFASTPLLLLALVAAFVPLPSQEEITKNIPQLKREADPYKAVMDMKPPAASAELDALPAIDTTQADRPRRDLGDVIAAEVTRRYFDCRSQTPTD